MPTKQDNQLVIFGYDPGGNGRHGIAILYCEVVNKKLRPVQLECKPLATTSTVIEAYDIVAKAHAIVAVGIDTLTAWSTAHSGWRPADLQLRKKYYENFKHSVASPNGLRGSMTLNGALLLQHIQKYQKLSPMITEAHPKVCAQTLGGSKDLRWENDSKEMVTLLLRALSLKTEQVNGLSDANSTAPEDHCYDAAMGALAALKGHNKEWTHDLHAIEDTQLVHPFGKTHFWWPEALPAL